MINRVCFGFENVSADYAEVIREIASRRLSERAGIQVSEDENEYKVTFIMSREHDSERYHKCT